MGSLPAFGIPVVSKANNVLRHSHNGNFVLENDTLTDTQSTISNSGVIRTLNLGDPFGLEFQPSQSRVFISGLALDRRELIHHPDPSGIRTLEFNKFTNDSGNLAHVVTRAMGIHTSIQDRESPNSSLGPMVARTERKVFFLDSDTGLASGLAAWEIFDGSGNPVGTQTGTTDTDISPEPTFDQP